MASRIDSLIFSMFGQGFAEVSSLKNWRALSGVACCARERSLISVHLFPGMPKLKSEPQATLLAWKDDSRIANFSHCNLQVPGPVALKSPARIFYICLVIRVPP